MSCPAILANHRTVLISANEIRAQFLNEMRRLPWLYGILLGIGSMWLFLSMLMVYFIDESNVRKMSEFDSLSLIQNELKELQLKWFESKHPILTSTILQSKGLKLIFAMKHIPEEYNNWSEALWTCNDDISAVVVGSDPHFHTLIVECPADTALVSVNDAKYTIRPDLKSWKMSISVLSACTMIKGAMSLALVHQWIVYHSSLGFEQFYIYLNDEIEEVPFHHPSVHWIPFQDELHVPFFLQQAMQNDCIHRAKGRSQWVGLFDVDEYFQLFQQISMPAFLKLYTNQSIGGIQVKNWFFGKHPKEKIPASKEFLIDRYVWRAPKPITSGREKLIVQPVHVDYFSVHMITLGEKMVAVDPETQLRLNHYRRPDKGVWGYYKPKSWSKLVLDESMRYHLISIQMQSRTST